MGTLFLRTLQPNNSNSIEKSKRCFVISAEYATFAVTYFEYTESVACSRQTNVGNSTEERISRHLTASYPFVDIGVGLLLIYLQGFLRPV